MAFHVGIDPHLGKVAYCNEYEKLIVDINTKMVNSKEIKKVALIFEKIKSKINGNLGCACICLNDKYGNEIRKKFIECGLKSGFKNVEVIDWNTAIYLNAMSQINYKPLNGNVIWIKDSYYFYVWEINNQKAKYSRMCKADPSKLNELQKVVDESKFYMGLNKGPDVVLCDAKIDESNLRKISECRCFFYQDYSSWYSKGSLIKARITAGDSEFTHLETTCFLSQRFSLKIGNNVITTFEKTQQLPIFYTETIVKNSKNDKLKVNIQYVDDDTRFELPEYSPIFLTFTIDQNKIFSVTFDQKPNVNNIADKSHLFIHRARKTMQGTGCDQSPAPPPIPRHGQYPPPPTGNGMNPFFSVTFNVKPSVSGIGDESHISLMNASDKHNENSVSKTVKTASFYSIPKVQAPYNIGKNAVGIDLGTSRCCVAVIRKNGITTVALDNNGERLFPSYVSYGEENVLCGKIVVERLRNYSKSTIFDTKRIIGRSMSDIEIDIFWPFGIFEINSKVCLEVEKFDGKATVIPEEVSAALLKHIKEKTEEFLGKRLSKAVITVPAAFNEAQKNATLEAATIAGWREITLLPEPIAAAFAYFNDLSISNNSNVLLFDLGGGTLDVCIFKIQNNQIEIISNTGDSKFGGRDFDTVLINYFKNALSTKYGISLVKNKKYLLMVKCQAIKEILSVMENASLDVDDFDPAQEGRIQISQKEFQKMCELLLNKVKNTLYAALHNSNFNANQINKVLHVGGGSRMPMIKQLLRNMFPASEHCIEEHPDEVVAIGAAYYAYSLPSDS